MDKSDRIEERIYKSIWHLLIAGVGVFEYKSHKSRLSKFLSAGLIAFHVDAAIADALDTPSLSRRILDRVIPNETTTPKRNRF